MIEQWNNLDGSVDWLWSVWKDGSRIHMGGAHKDPGTAEAEARSFCRDRYSADPDAVIHL